jgi:hypothetical protein
LRQRILDESKRWSIEKRHRTFERKGW